MNREIKFRVYIKELNRIDEVVELYCDGDAMTCSYPYRLEAEDIELMQYTGLKDKNGVEIYEGDILALDNESERGSYHIYKIEYNADKARFVGVDGDEISCMPSIVNHHDGAGRYMVIGNIYENPELILMVMYEQSI